MFLIQTKVPDWSDNNNNNNNNHHHHHNHNQDGLQGLQSYSSERCISTSWRLSHATGARNIFFDIIPLRDQISYYEITEMDSMPKRRNCEKVI